MLSILKRPRPRRRRVAVLGLDGAEPSLVFDAFAGHLPNLDRLRRRGAYARLESVAPASCSPAWACMATGKDPGTLGIYGARDRADHSYEAFAAGAAAVAEPRLWDVVARHGGQSIVLGVPEHARPPSPEEEVAEWTGGPAPEVRGMELLEGVCTATRTRFELARRLLGTRPWDLFMMVEPGIERIQRGFWRDLDPLHRHHRPDSAFRDAIFEYYRYVDREVGALLSLLDDDTSLLVVSDHGARRSEGGICLNEWLIREGYLVLRRAPDPARGPVPLAASDVDWSRTKAWAEGGDHGRVFLNVRGREPEGIVEPAEYESLRDEVARGLEAIGDERGQPIATRCLAPDRLYRRLEGMPPDLLVAFGELAWRAEGRVGCGELRRLADDAAPDDSNPAPHGLLLYHDPARDLGGRELQDAHLLQVAPTVLELLELPVPADMQSTPIRELAPPQPPRAGPVPLSPRRSVR